MVIDANMYWFPEYLFEDKALLEQFLSEIPEEYGWYGYAKQVEQSDKTQIIIEKPKGYQSVNYVQGDYTIEKQLSDMDMAGVDKAVLKLPCCQEWMSLEMCKVFNGGMYEHAKKSDGRLITLGVIPPVGTRENLDELARCKTKYGMKGVQLSAHYGDRYLDHKDFADFFASLNEYGMTAYVHHTPVPVEYGAFFEYNNLRRSYGRCVDQGLAIGRELFSGFFTKYPNLRLVHSMLGGGFFAIANMLFPPKPKNAGAVGRFSSDNDVVEQFRKNIYFEMSHAQPWGKEQLTCAVNVLGADHIAFGTSYPVRREWLLDGPAFIDGLSISETEKDMLLAGTAKQLYGIS